MADTGPLAQPPMKRLALCNELLALRRKIIVAPPNRRSKIEVLAGRRVKSIRNVLLGRSSGLVDSMMTPGVATQTLLQSLRGIKDAPAHERVATARYALSIRESIAALRRADLAAGAETMGDGFETDDDKELSRLIAESLGDADPVIDDCIGRGALGDALRDELASMVGHMDRAKAEQTALAADYTARLEAVKARYNRMSMEEFDMPSGPEKRAAWDAASEFWEKNYVPLDREMRDKYAAISNAANEVSRAVGRKIIGRVLDASKVSEDEAKRWADAQDITPAAKARFRKLGYPVDKVRADMIEFYRVTGGRLKRVRIDSNGSRRANATDIEAHGKVGTINLGSAFDRRVLWHELAHHMEADPVAKQAAGRFIRRRSVDGGKQYSLRSMTNNRGYRSNEVAMNCNFFDPYVGKIYGDGATEVFAMGVETLSDPVLLANRTLKDPQTIEFVTGFLMAEQHPLASAHMEMRDMITSMQEELSDVSGDRVAEMIKALAAKVELIPDGDRSWMGDNWVFESYTMGMTQVGRFGDGHYVFSGKVRNERGRKVSGYLLIHSGTTRTSAIPSSDINLVKAAVAVFEQAGYLPSVASLLNEQNLLKYAL